MFDKIKNIFENMSKKSNVALYLIAGAMFIIASIYIIMGVLKFI